MIYFRSEAGPQIFTKLIENVLANSLHPSFPRSIFHFTSLPGEIATFFTGKDAPRRSRKPKTGVNLAIHPGRGIKVLAAKLLAARRNSNTKNIGQRIETPSPLVGQLIRTVSTRTCCATRIGCVARPVNCERKRGGFSSSSIVESCSRTEQREREREDDQFEPCDTLWASIA